MCGSPRPDGPVPALRRRRRHGGDVLHLQVAEGATACSIPATRSRSATPIFTPYLEMPHLEDYDLKIVTVRRPAGEPLPVRRRELKKLLDPDGQGVLRRQPGQPERGRADAPRRSRRSARSCKKRPDLMLLTDDVYGTFVPGFRSLLGAYPHNTIGVYSYSKYFGCTGWRLGVIALHEDNLFDELIAKHPEDVQKTARQALCAAHARAAQAPVHRPHRRRQPRRRAQSHRGSLAAAAGHDDAVLALRAAWTRRRTTRRRASASCKQARRARRSRDSASRSQPNPLLRLLLRPDRLRVLGPQVRRRGRRRAG